MTISLKSIAKVGNESASRPCSLCLVPFLRSKQNVVHAHLLTSNLTTMTLTYWSTCFLTLHAEWPGWSSSSPAWPWHTYFLTLCAKRPGWSSSSPVWPWHQRDLDIPVFSLFVLRDQVGVVVLQRDLDIPVFSLFVLRYQVGVVVLQRDLDLPVFSLFVLRDQVGVVVL